VILGAVGVCCAVHQHHGTAFGESSQRGCECWEGKVIKDQTRQSRKASSCTHNPSRQLARCNSCRQQAAAHHTTRASPSWHHCGNNFRCTANHQRHSSCLIWRALTQSPGAHRYLPGIIAPLAVDLACVGCLMPPWRAGADSRGGESAAAGNTHCGRLLWVKPVRGRRWVVLQGGDGGWARQEQLEVVQRAVERGFECNAARH
jgi:hypothetical protein